jgi:predicted RNase H-like HicB family nuclease
MTASTMVKSNPLTKLSRAITFAGAIPNIDKTKTSYVIKMRRDEDGRFIARSTNLQGVVTDGSDKDEALSNAIEAIDAILEERGLDKEYSITLIET